MCWAEEAQTHLAPDSGFAPEVEQTKCKYQGILEV